MVGGHRGRGSSPSVDEGARLRIADDEAGTSWWTTPGEAARATMEAERAAKEAALARVAGLEAEVAPGGARERIGAKEAALARVAGLDAELARGRT